MGRVNRSKFLTNSILQKNVAFCLCYSLSYVVVLIWLTVITTFFLGGFKDLPGYCRHPDCTELSGMFYRHFQLLWNPADTDCDRSHSLLGAGYWGGQHFYYSADTSGIYFLWFSKCVLFLKAVALEQSPLYSSAHPILSSSGISGDI